MRKIFFILFILILSSLSAFAEYKPIPKNLSKQYKAEMEQIIDIEYIKAIQSINELIKNAENLRNNIIQNGYNTDDYIALSLMPDTALKTIDLDLFIKIAKTTCEKYLHIDYNPIAADNTYNLEIFIYPYFKDNNINYKKILKLNNYTITKKHLVKKYIKEVEKFRLQ